MKSVSVRLGRNLVHKEVLSSSQICRFSSVAVAKPMEERETDEKKSVEVCFPWRSAPKQPDITLSDYVTHHACKIMVHDIHLSKDSEIGPR